MSETVPVRELRAELRQVIDRVADLREHVIVTRHDRPAAVLVPVDQYEALEDTAEILSNAETMAAIDEGRREVERGETVTLDDLRRELRSLRVGTYRIIYQVDDEHHLARVLAVRHRSISDTTDPH